MEWVIAAVLVILTITGMAIVIVAFVGKRDRQEGWEPDDQWCVEMWNISQGYMLRLQFANNLVLGRGNLYSYVVDTIPVNMDATISREHCMLYEQNDRIYVWNMSAVNPAMINGRRLNQPMLLQVGDRLELGNSVFLVTNVD